MHHTLWAWNRAEVIVISSKSTQNQLFDEGKHYCSTCSTHASSYFLCSACGPLQSNNWGLADNLSTKQYISDFHFHDNTLSFASLYASKLNYIDLIQSSLKVSNENFRDTTLLIRKFHSLNTQTHSIRAKLFV